MTVLRHDNRTCPPDGELCHSRSVALGQTTPYKPPAVARLSA